MAFVLGVQPKAASDLLIRRSYQIEEILFSQTSVSTLKKLSGFISSVKNLKSVRFQFLKNKLPKDLIQKLAKVETLRSVKVVDVPEDSGFDKLGDCRNLRHVTMSRCNIRPFEYKGIVTLPNLRSLSLDLSYTDLSNYEFEKSLDNADKSQLVNLSLVLNSADDCHLIAIATNCPNLNRLSIESRTDSSRITSNGIKSLLNGCTDLKFVELQMTGLEDLTESLSKENQNLTICYKNKNKLLIAK